jgi:hypothetical protein
MGEVYRAKLKREVAVKALPSSIPKDFHHGWVALENGRKQDLGAHQLGGAARLHSRLGRSGSEPRM